MIMHGPVSAERHWRSNILVLEGYLCYAQKSIPEFEKVDAAILQ